MLIYREGFTIRCRSFYDDIDGFSALLTTTMSEMERVVEQFKSAGLGTKALVGGAPITPEFADKIGADAYALNAGEAVDKVVELL